MEKPPPAEAFGDSFWGERIGTITTLAGTYVVSSSEPGWRALAGTGLMIKKKKKKERRKEKERILKWKGRVRKPSSSHACVCVYVCMCMLSI